jgi:hypothetical protein
MNIHNLHAHRLATAYRNAGTTHTSKAEGEAAAQAVRPVGLPPQKDRAEFSEAPKPKALQHKLQSHEVNFARKALESLPGLSEERKAEIESRLASGEYSREQVIKHIVQGLIQEFKGQPDTMPPTTQPPASEPPATLPPSTEA